MDVRLRLPDDPYGDETKQLYDWLIRDRELHLDADISLRPAAGETARPEPGSEPGTSMGDTLDIVQFIVDSGFQLLSLGIAVAAWHKARRPRSPLVVERGRFRAELPAGATEEQINAFLRALENEDSTGGTGSPAPGPDDDSENSRAPESDDQ
ncbi:effector-associated constant component EACC1 [Streptomyces sp. UG1]|uniref:effector-associated constant component EACC1 n=1 Tax=Streptomyces sp. UG1 TaxID=3417652 RepID=UPI003CEFE897